MADAPLPKKRGRPPKLDATGTPLKKPVSEGPPRKRGRPRKDPSAPPKPAPSGPKRGRGRPRKDDSTAPSKRARLSTDVAATASTGATTSTPSKKRGRPKKSTGEASAKAVNGMAEGSSGLLLDKIIGIYSLECKEVEDNWPNDAEEMELTITRTSESPLGLIGGFNLGIIEGTMLFAADKPTLDKFRAVMSKSGVLAATQNDDNEAQGDGTSEDAGDVPHASKSASVNDRRVYFSWRGRSTSEGQIYTEEGSSSQDGYIDFTSNDAVSFNGVAGFPALGNRCKFNGTKIDNDAADAPQPWTTFSRKAAEQSAVNRWR
ncbi:hypothetical protein AJ78_00713 [Emergomyces pasteurianus Ep9510]|uniref:AT hook motif family protein n=1 Tax=Emergomyces pasteurianus Ep9510 TaxID=1447872 RepID=A0A1J9QT26_9EURO|nr:hypothetical protein AJ78_00713 [Emergomyces pasteurianus Ep9510]